MANENTAAKKKPHIVLVLVIILLLIPLAILAAILLSSLEDSSQPVVGKRYKNELDPAITEENIAKLEEVLTFDGVDSVQINFKTARVAILIDVADDANAKTIKAKMNDAYKKVNEVLPIKTYFTNKYTEDETIIKMYDLQIDAFNVISGDNQIHYVLTKTGASKKESVSLVSSAKNKEVSKEVLSQNTEEGE